MQLMTMAELESGLPATLRGHWASVTKARHDAMMAMAGLSPFPIAEDGRITGPGTSRIQAVGEELSFMRHLALVVIGTAVVACGLMAWLSELLGLGVGRFTIACVSLAMVALFVAMFGYGYWQVRNDVRRRLIEVAGEAIAAGDTTLVVHDSKSGARTLPADGIGSASFESRDGTFATLRIGGRAGEMLLVMHGVPIDDARRVADLANGWASRPRS